MTEAHATLPQRLRLALAAEQGKTMKELSVELHVAEKELPMLLDKVQRTLKREGISLRVEPPCCLGCGFVFAERERFAKPGRCPRCRSERISHARFRA
jgi:transcriptional regulator